MQTFLHQAEDFKLGAVQLDYRRNGKQRVEGYQILRSLKNLAKGWHNHPAVKMWRGWEEALAWYTIDHCDVWSNIRGYKDTVAEKIHAMYPTLPPPHMVLTPPWIDDVVESHRSNLIRKLPEHYGPLWPNIPDNIPYVWPVK
jgi:hypothetical protein